LTPPEGCSRRLIPLFQSVISHKVFFFLNGPPLRPELTLFLLPPTPLGRESLHFSWLPFFSPFLNSDSSFPCPFPGPVSLPPIHLAKFLLLSIEVSCLKLRGDTFHVAAVFFRNFDQLLLNFVFCSGFFKFPPPTLSIRFFFSTTNAYPPKLTQTFSRCPLFLSLAALTWAEHPIFGFLYFRLPPHRG